MLISDKMYELGSKRSVIRDLFEYGKMRAKEVGAENVYDFSLEILQFLLLIVLIKQ